MKHIIKSCCFVTNDIWMFIHVLLKYVNILHLQVKKNVYYLKRQWFIVLNIIFFSGSGTIGYIYNQISVKLWILRIKKKTPDICLTKSLQSIRKRKLISRAFNSIPVKPKNASHNQSTSQNCGYLLLILPFEI